MNQRPIRSHYSCCSSWCRCCPGGHQCAPVLRDPSLLCWPRSLQNVQLLLCPDVGVDGLGVHLAGADALAG